MLLSGAAERCCWAVLLASRGCVARLRRAAVSRGNEDANDAQHRSAAGLEREAKQLTGTSENFR